MKWIELSKERVIIWFITLLFLGLGIVGLSFLLKLVRTLSIGYFMATVVLLGPSIAFFWIGCLAIQQQERAVVEVFGKYDRVLKPGIRWKFPIPKVVSIRARINIWEQSIELFTGQPTIDFAGGGTATLVQPKVWVRLLGAVGQDYEEEIADNLQKAIYEIEDWEEAIKERMELAFRTTLNNLTVEEALTEVYVVQRGWWEIVAEHFPDLEEEFREWGWEVKEITVSDYDWSAPVLEIRRQVFQQQRKIEIAKLAQRAAQWEAKQKAREAGQTLGEMKKILTQKRFGFTEQEAKQIANRLVLYFKGADSGQLKDIRLGSTEGSENLLSLVSKVMENFRK